VNCALRREVLRRIRINVQEFNEVAQVRSNDFEILLYWLDPEKARKTLLPVSFASDSYEWTWSDSITVLASQGELRGFDHAFSHLASLFGDQRRNMEVQLRSYFRWPEHTPFFVEWYQSIRPRLKSGRGADGQVAFWLENGTPFDDKYFASMPKPVPGAP
jgi:hypothetical protein